MNIEEIAKNYRRGLISEVAYDMYKCADELGLDLEDDVLIDRDEYLFFSTKVWINASSKDPYEAIKLAKMQNTYNKVSRNYTMGYISRKLFDFYGQLFDLGYPINDLTLADAHYLCGEI